MIIIDSCQNLFSWGVSVKDRGFDIKRLVFFCSFVIPIFLIVSCDLLGEPPVDNTPRENKEPNVKKEYYTVRLGGGTFDSGGGVTVGLLDSVTLRALADDSEQTSYDFFEVVFYYNGSNDSSVGHRVARTTWDIGVIPEINNVYGNGKGNPPATPSDTPVNYANIGVPAAGSGSALLFAGTKEDKTLLAVGRLSHVDNRPVGSGNLIGPNTKVVTFEVTALKAGVAPDQTNVGSSSFKLYNTEAQANARADNGITEIRDDILIDSTDKKQFPFFQLRSTPNNVHYGSYLFDVQVGTTSFTQYAAGIVLAGDYDFEAKNPRYSVTEGQYKSDSRLVQDISMTANGQLDMMGDNKVKFAEGTPAYYPGGVSAGPGGTPAAIAPTAARTFKNPVVFKIDTSASLPPPHTGTVFALVFEVFVYNLTALPTGTFIEASNTAPTFSSGTSPVKWRITSGTKWLDLDDGAGGEGGAIFLGTGDVAGYLDQSGSRSIPLRGGMNR